MMRIAHIIDTLNWGGAQKLEVTFAQMARRRGIKLTVICLRQDPNTSIPAELAAAGVRFVTCPSRRLLDPARIWSIRQFLRRGRYDVVQTHLTYANVIGTMAGRLAGVPVAATLHSVGRDKRHDHPIKNRLESWSLRYGATRIIAVADSVAAVHQRELGRRQIDIIPNAVPAAAALSPRRRAEMRAALTRDSARPLLISVGRLSPPKGYADLIKAFVELHESRPEAALLIVGDGALRAELADQIAQYGLSRDILMLGARNDVPDLLCASDIYVSASHWEGLPLAMLEAMSVGLPVVATGVSDVPRVLADTGLVVPPRDSAALAAAISRLLGNPALMRALGAAAKSRVASHYSPEIWFDKLLGLYAEMCVSRREIMAREVL